MALHPAVRLFRELTSVPTAPFYEEGPAGKALAWIRRHLRSASVRRTRGGILVSYRGAGPGPSLALAAHLDHPAFHLSGAIRTGARATLKGGLPRDLLPGARVEAFAARPRDNRPLARGTVQADGKEFRVLWDAPLPKTPPAAFACLALAPWEVEGRWLRSRSIDDLLGCAVSLETLRRLAASRAKANVTVLLHRAEEVGFVGALELIRSGAVPPGDSVLSIECSRQLPTARPGMGPVIRLGDRMTLFDANLLQLLDDAAEAERRRGVRSQRTRLTGGACEATAYLAFGYESAGLAIPLVNYHNGGPGRVAEEQVRLEDVGGAVELLVEAAQRFAGRELRGRVRERLAGVIRREGKRL
ncbi:MAG: hypothetical protein HY554_10690 [Elusimicrobia bacterium]|nr:hypothetical protein [Elusimicrobiota bacterium]